MTQHKRQNEMQPVLDRDKVLEFDTLSNFFQINFHQINKLIELKAEVKSFAKFKLRAVFKLCKCVQDHNCKSAQKNFLIIHYELSE